MLTQDPPSELLPGAGEECNLRLVSATLLYSQPTLECLSKAYDMSQAQRAAEVSPPKDCDAGNFFETLGPEEVTSPASNCKVSPR